MAEQGRLSGLLARACAKDDSRAREAAFDELLRLLMIYVRAGMGGRLRDHRESVDVCQSIAKSFVEDFEGGGLVFENEAALAGYLQKVVRSKLADLSRRDTAAKRGGGERAAGIDGLGASGGLASEPASASPGPGSFVADLEQHARAMASLSEEERTLARLRAQGMEWEEIARHVGREAAAVRQQFSRAQRRLAGGLEE